MKQLWAAAALAIALGGTATCQVAILQIKIVEGEGAVYAPGARVARPLTATITDEAGRPVAGAAVSFHLPEQGPGGAFPNGLRTEITHTDERGYAILRNLRLNRLSGRFQIRIIASKEQARAGTISFQYIAEPGSGAARAGSSWRGKWIALAAAVGGGAAAAFAVSHSRGNAPPAAMPVPPLAIGAPSISVARP